MPAVHVEDAEHGVALRAVAGREAGAVEEADDAGHHQRERRSPARRPEPESALPSGTSCVSDSPGIRTWRVRRIIRFGPARVGTLQSGTPTSANLADEEVMQLVQRGRPARLRAAVRPPRRSGLLARLPDGGKAGDGRGHRRRRRSCRSGAAACATTRRAEACAPGCSGSSTTGPIDGLRAQHGPRAPARDARGRRGASRGARADGRGGRPAARRRVACGARLSTLPDEQRRTIELAYFGGFTPEPDRRDARGADRHGQGPDAARPRQDEARARRRAWHDATTRAISDDVGAYLLGALNDVERAGVRAPPARLRASARTRSSACGRPRTRCPRSVRAVRAAGRAEARR